MRRWRVAITDPMHARPAERLARFADPVLLPRGRDARFAALATSDALIVRTPVTEDEIAAGARLKLIVRHGAGLDFIPVALARARGILVASVPDANTEAVAEHVIGAVLAVARSFVELDGSVRAGDWSARNRTRGMQLNGKLLGVVGFGRIGRCVAQKAHAGLGMRIAAFDPKATGLPPHVERFESVDELLAAADVVTLHVPLDPATRGLISRKRIALMKRGALLVNAARGGVIDEAALAEALAGGRIGGAAVDVFDTQPVPHDHPLLRAPNVLLTPHTASLTEDAYIAMGEGAVDEVERAWRGRPLLNPAA